MDELKFIISEIQILIAVRDALEVNIKELKIIDILMHDIMESIEAVLYDDCERYNAERSE